MQENGERVRKVAKKKKKKKKKGEMWKRDERMTDQQLAFPLGVREHRAGPVFLRLKSRIAYACVSTEQPSAIPTLVQRG